MAHSILVRNVSDEIYGWIEKGRRRKGQSQQEFVTGILAKVVRDFQMGLFDDTVRSLMPPPESPKFTFIDLFSGIGGFRIGLQNAGGKCLWSCEWDRYAQKTYYAWFGESPAGDITKTNIRDIPDCDVLAAGFPCQPFSIAGVSKKKSLGRAHGFKDKSQGTLFFHIARIVESKRPKVLLLENVKNLLAHDKGKTWEVIKGTLEELGYAVNWRVIDAKHYVPQHRERVFIVCFDKQRFGDSVKFTYPQRDNGRGISLRDILEDKPEGKYTLSDHLWKYLQDYAKKHQSLGNGFGFGLVDLGGISRTLRARYYKDGSEILIPQSGGRNPRRLTPGEAARLMGFPDKLKPVVSDTQAYKQFGNAVCPLIVEDIGKSIVKVLEQQASARGKGRRSAAKSYPVNRESGQSESRVGVVREGRARHGERRSCGFESHSGARNKSCT